MYVLIVEIITLHWYFQESHLHSDTNTQKLVHIIGREQLFMVSVVRSGGRQFTGTYDKRGKKTYNIQLKSFRF